MAPLVLQVIEKSENVLYTDVVKRESGDRAAATTCQKIQEEEECVTVRSNRMSARAADALQVIAEVRFDQPEQRIGCATQGHLRVCARRRLRRLAATCISSGVAVRYFSVPRILSWPMYAESSGNRAWTSICASCQRARR